MALLFGANRRQHRIRVGVTRWALVAIGDLRLLRGFHVAEHGHDRSDSRLQAQPARDLDSRWVRHGLAELAQAFFDSLTMPALGVRDLANHLRAPWIAHAIREDRVDDPRLHLALPRLEQPFYRLARRTGGAHFLDLVADCAEVWRS
jgi:hypothetical protein